MSDGVGPFGPTAPSRGEIGGIGSGVVHLTTMDDGQEVEVDVHPDGSVMIGLGGPPDDDDDLDQEEFGANLADRLPDNILMGIAEELIEGVDSDIQSRSDLVDQYERGIDLLGTRIEDVSTPSSTGRSVSRLGHPLLMESMIRYHAGAEAEMLPAEGPAKVMTIGESSPEEDRLADDFESDFNYFLTEIATEYYPDTSGMLMHQGYCGNAYKKIYRDAMRDRPVSESVSMLDLIVSEEATDLDNATRVTHQIMMARNQLRRMQISGHYRDIDLGWSQLQPNSADSAIKQAEGLSPMAQRPQDVPYTLWETDLDIDVDRHAIAGKWEDAAPPGLPLPYKVTVDQGTRQVLGVWRNWKDGDKLYRKRNMYVRYGLIPSLGFHHWGFLQILGNHTRALRAIWRLLVDCGMFSNFPGGVKLRSARTDTNEIAPGPGEWIDVDAPASSDIRNMLMPLPYKTIDAVFVQLAQMIQEGAMRLGGAVMLETGEGRTNVPVGTMMSMIEQQTQIMAGVHKRNHLAQRSELRKLRELFIENPRDLWKLARDPKRQWEVGEEFADLNLVPASDPNIPAQVHRIQQAVALMTIAQQNPQIYNMYEVHERVLRTIRISSPESLFAQQPAAQQPPGDAAKMAALQQKGQLAQQSAQQKMQELAIKMADEEKDRQSDAQRTALESMDRAADRQSTEKDRAEARQSTERVALIREETERLKLQAQQAKDAAEAAAAQPTVGVRSFGGEGGF